VPDIGEGLDVIDEGGFPKKARGGGIRRPGPGLAPPPLNGRNESRFLAAHEGPSPDPKLHVEGKIRVENPRPKEAKLSGLGDGHFQALYGQWVFRAHVDVALFRADGVGGDGHALEDAVGIALEDRPIHEGAGVALIAVADHVFWVSLGLPHGLPFFARGEARAAPAPQAGTADLGNDLLRGHLGEDFGQGFVAAHGDVFLDLFRIDLAAVLEDDLLLAGEEGENPGLRPRPSPKEPPHRPTF
jgi:hypothetical protein